MSDRTRPFLPRLVLSAGLFATAFPLAGTIVFAQAPAPAVNAKDFAGTWHWTFQGKPFVTMVLEPKADGFTGSVTNASVHTDTDGKITDVSADAGSSPIIRSSLEKGVLRIVCKDGEEELEWAVTLTSPTTAEIVFAGKDAPKMEPIHADKAH